MTTTTHTQAKFSSPGFRPVYADSMRDAADAFAGREARKLYGKAGGVRTLMQQGHSRDGKMAEWEAFIGVRRGDGFVGKNFWFSVYCEESV